MWGEHIFMDFSDLKPFPDVREPHCFGIENVPNFHPFSMFHPWSHLHFAWKDTILWSAELCYERLGLDTSVRDDLYWPNLPGVKWVRLWRILPDCYFMSNEQLFCRVLQDPLLVRLGCSTSRLPHSVDNIMAIFYIIIYTLALPIFVSHHWYII